MNVDGEHTELMLVDKVSWAASLSTAVSSTAVDRLAMPDMTVTRDLRSPPYSDLLGAVVSTRSSSRSFRSARRDDGWWCSAACRKRNTEILNSALQILFYFILHEAALRQFSRSRRGRRVGSSLTLVRQISSPLHLFLPLETKGSGGAL